MSYILDALRKSEQDRQRGKVPDFHSSPAPVAAESGKRANIWAVIAIAVVLINVVLVAVFWDRLAPGSADSKTATFAGETELPSKQTEQVEPTPGSTSALELPETASSDDSFSLREEAPVASEAPPVSQAVEQEADSGPQFETIRPGQVVTEDIPLDEPDSGGGSPQMAYVPQIEELSSLERQNIPDMTFSSHMFSSVSKYRSVIINGKRLKEGQRYNNDIVVREITDSGVVMSQGALLFQVDVLGRWAQ